jgi:hypothetical protein
MFCSHVKVFKISRIYKLPANPVCLHYHLFYLFGSIINVAKHGKLREQIIPFSMRIYSLNTSKVIFFVLRYYHFQQKYMHKLAWNLMFFLLVHIYVVHCIVICTDMESLVLDFTSNTN